MNRDALEGKNKVLLKLNTKSILL